jgi:DNA-binding NtrC family response regulator
MAKLLLIGDDQVLLWAMTASLRQAGYEVEHVGTVAATRAVLQAGRYDVALLDMILPDGDGFTLLPELVAQAPEMPVVILSSHHDPAAVVRALRAGAVDYLGKPAEHSELLLALESAIRHAQRIRRVEALHQQQGEARARSGPLALPIGSSASWQRALDLLCAAAQSERTTVLLTGEPGVGKEVAATLLHQLSPRGRQPLVVVNAACLTPNLIESELFGHEPGAFTGAQGRRRGLFEQAAGGTLFLDEIGELPLDLQGKLLRVLEGHPFRRVGGERDVSVDVRLICATNRDLGTEVQAGRFRADLYHRLRVFENPLPPLRERTADIAELALYFTRLLGAQLGFSDARISSDALEVLKRHAWPGNVRELRNVIERALLLSRGAEITRRHLPAELALAPLPGLPAVAASRPIAAATSDSSSAAARDDETLEECIRKHVLRVYRNTGNNLTRAAAQLAISRMALRRRLQNYGVK